MTNNANKKINWLDNATNLLMLKFQSRRITYRKLIKKFIKICFALFGSVILTIIFMILFIVNIGG